MAGPIIRVQGLSKRYVLSHQDGKTNSFRDALSNNFKRFGSWINRNNENDLSFTSKEEFWALKDVSFDIQQGDRVGVIGRNGAGKSTLLKILSRITEPTTGSISINGRVASLLEVGTGFHPELSGRENIFLNGAILGMNRGEIRKKFDEIVAFAEIEKFIDTPVKRYSSGMYVRLAFAVAAHLEPEVLIVDEVLAVGDAQFQKKCLGKMQDVSVNEGRTVLFVSHNMQAISSLTNTCIYLKNGGLIKSGPTAQIRDYYINTETTNSLIYENIQPAEDPSITRVKLSTSYEHNVQIHGDKMEIEVEINLPYPLRNGALSIQVFNSLDIPLVHVWLFNSEQESFKMKGTNKIKFVIPKFRLFFGGYTLTLYLAERGGNELLQKIEKVCPFEVVMFNTTHDHPWREGTCTYLEEYYCELEYPSN